MANGGWNRQQAQFENEVRKEGHRRAMEYVAIGLVAIAAVACGAAVVWPTTTTKAEDGKVVAVSGPSESAKSAAQTLLTTIVGAAIGYGFKQSPRAGQAPPAA